MLKAIETRYKGFRFRSRLEARHAVFLDVLGVPWEYELEGYDLGKSGRYLPDFWLPTFQAFVEIKPDYDQPAISKLGDLVEQHNHCIGHLFYGSFGTLNPRIHSVCTDLGDSSGGMGYFDTFWAICKNCKRPYIDFDTNHTLFLDTSFSDEYSPCPCGNPIPSVDWEAVRQGGNPTPVELQNAYAAARSARFEHGEHGR